MSRQKGLTTQLVRTTVRLQPKHAAWLESAAREKQRPEAEVLRECVATTLLKQGRYMETYASNTKPKGVYLAKKQLDLIVVRCKKHGGTMSGLIRCAISEQLNKSLIEIYERKNCRANVAEKAKETEPAGYKDV